MEPTPAAARAATAPPPSPEIVAEAATAAAVGSPATSTPPESSSVSPTASPPQATPVAIEKNDPRAELLAARVDLMEQLLLAQHDREVNLYRDTIRLVTIFGGAFAGLCMVGLFAAAFLNYRALIAVQAASARVTLGYAPASTNGLLSAPGAVPGIEKVQASGQRFQSRMSGLEQRLSELEHIAGREPPPPETSESTVDVPTVAATGTGAAEADLVPPPPRTAPRALILVHKAQTLMNLGKLTEALSTLDDAAALDGAKTEVHLTRGQVLEKLGRLGDALRSYDTAVGADEQNTSALLMKAGVLNRQERFSEALACYERALEVHRATA